MHTSLPVSPLTLLFPILILGCGTADPCEDVGCSSHGQCFTDEKGEANCDCDVGYSATAGPACAFVAPPDTCTRFVHLDSTSDSPDGLSWATAFSGIQPATKSAVDGINASDDEESCDVWVGKGTYKIFVSSPRDVVNIGRGVKLLGGFAGSEHRRADRNTDPTATVLDGTDIRGMDRHVYRVVTGYEDSLIDGFTIIGGRAVDRYKDYGGGLVGVDMTVRNCIFTDNTASKDGGGAYLSGEYATVEDCKFIGNEALEMGGGLFMKVINPRLINTTFENNSAVGGGGAYLQWSEGGLVEDCLFSNNQTVSSNARGGGGGLHIHESRIDVSRCRFIDNNSEAWGGGLFIIRPAPVRVENSIFQGNYGGLGGGVLVDNTSEEMTASIINCTFTENQARGGASLAFGTNETTAFVTNSILWGNSITTSNPDDKEIFHQLATVTYSNVEGGYPGNGNIDSDPRFYNISLSDFQLKSDSPCVDAGDSRIAPSLDYLERPREDSEEAPNVGVGPPWVDMGAFEYQGGS